MNQRISLLHVHSGAIGFGRYGVELARALRAMDVTVYDHLPTPDQLATQPQLEHLGLVNAGDQSGIAPVVCWVSVPTHARGWYKGQYPVISCMWEATTLPPSYRESLHEFAQLNVPSEQNVELFCQYHPNVAYVPLGVDPQVWHYTPRRPPGLTFDFLIGGAGARKGTDLAHQAFRKLWPRPGSWPKEAPVPRLIMKNPRGEPFYGDRVEMITGRISAEAEVALYESAHCYLQPSRGEGFGLQPLQAIAQGIPTILTDAHGHKAFSHLGYGLSSELAKSAYFIYGDAGDWWEPSLDDLCDHMQWIYENYDAACAKAMAGAAEVAERFTWAHTARAFVDAIGEDRLRGDIGPGGFEWYEPTLQRFRVVTNRDWGCDIAGARYQFRKGDDAWVLADVKRILFEADLLDPVCLEGTDPGLLPEQVARLDGYRERHSFCQLCGSDLTGPSRADRIFEELEREAIT